MESRWWNDKHPLQFKEYNATSDLSCTNITDKFSTTNSSASLTYKVGLLSSPEMNILNNRNARKTGRVYWLDSPYNFYSSLTDNKYVDSYGGISHIYVSYSADVRPAISLKPGTEYTSGDGSMANTYVVKKE